MAENKPAGATKAEVRRGWIGSWEELSQALLTAGCDTDDGGRYVVSGTIVSYMGMGKEFVVGADAKYYRKGEACDLLAALDKPNCGIAVAVVL
jgi:hypothetical protein